MAEYQKVCAWCGVAFVAKSPKALFCGPKCMRASNRDKNPEVRKEIEARYKANHPDRLREIQKRSREKNLQKRRDATAACMRRLRQNNPDAARQKDRDYWWKNREHLIEQRRAARLKGGAGAAAIHVQQTLNKLKQENGHDQP